MLWVLIRSASPLFSWRNKKDISIFRMKKASYLLLCFSFRKGTKQFQVAFDLGAFEKPSVFHMLTVKTHFILFVLCLFREKWGTWYLPFCGSVLSSPFDSTYFVCATLLQVLTDLFIKLCRHFLHALKICMWFGHKSQIYFCHFFRIVNLVNFCLSSIHVYRVCVLCAQFVQVLTDLFETSRTYSIWSEDVHVVWTWTWLNFSSPEHNHYCIEDQKASTTLSPFASWPCTMIKPQWLELPKSCTSFHGPKDVRDI